MSAPSSSVRSIWVDTEAFPIVVIPLAGVIQRDDFDAYLAACEGVLALGERFALLYDTRLGRQVAMELRQDQARWLRAHRQRMEALCCGYALVIDKPLYRFVLSTVLLLTPLPAPYEVFASYNEARIWAMSRLYT